MLPIALRAWSRFDAGMIDKRTISQLETEGYRWIGCECCKGTVWVPFKMSAVLHEAAATALTTHRARTTIWPTA